MPLPAAPPFPDMPPLADLHLAAGRQGAPYQNRDDLLFVSFRRSVSAAALFTRSSLAAWPVRLSRRHLKESGGRARALLVNAGNANALSGAKGRESAERIARACADKADCPLNEIFLASTGRIGRALSAEPVLKALEAFPKDAPSLSWERAARAIMTTDRFPKGAFRQTFIKDAPARLCGIAKGAGMIAPDMATTLAFLFTDAALSASIAGRLLLEAAEESFNALSVDGDSSTNDTLMLFATGEGRSAAMSDLTDFRQSLREILDSLARQIARDGEGATKMMIVRVSGAKSAVSARRVARAVAESLLVKAALYGGDPNWGRVAAAMGKTGEPLREEALRIRIGGAALFDGEPLAISDAAAAALRRHMEGDEIRIEAHLGTGEAEAVFRGCDLTPDYLRINSGGD